MVMLSKCLPQHITTARTTEAVHTFVYLAAAASPAGAQTWWTEAVCREEIVRTEERSVDSPANCTKGVVTRVPSNFLFRGRKISCIRLPVALWPKSIQIARPLLLSSLLSSLWQI